MARPFVVLVDGKRACSRCGVWRSLTEFSPAKDGALGHSSRCKACVAECMRMWRAGQPRISRAKPENVAKRAAAHALFRTGRRVCTVCRVEKALSDFPRLTESPTGYAYRCKDCNREAMTRWRDKGDNRALASKRSVDSARKRRYGMSVHEIAAWLAEQGGCCAICQQPLSVATRQCHVDHDHMTGANRGILCSGCNTGIGLLRDDAELLRAAEAYLDRAKRKENAA